MCQGIWVSLLLGLWSVGLPAQETRGSIVGTVTDAQAAVIPGAAVTVTNVGTNVSFRLTTNASGYYEALLLLPGSYAVSVEAPGFKKALRTGLTLAWASSCGWTSSLRWAPWPKP